MNILGIDGMTGEQLAMELANGGRFVVYRYCLSAIVITFQRSSDVHFVRGGESGVLKGMPYTLLSIVAGWWGIPWGPIFTIAAVVTNLRGGKDVTAEIVGALAPATA
jgi:hypothetical protein